MEDNTDTMDETEDAMVEESDTLAELLDEIAKQRDARIADQLEAYGCRTPSTFEKDLGHPIHLNERAQVAPDHAQGRDDVVVINAWQMQRSLRILLPRETGTCWRMQTDGMLMEHPVLEGTMVPVRSQAVHSLPSLNYLEYDNGDHMQDTWTRIRDEVGLDWTDVAPPDGYAQSQEGLRWVQITDAETDADWAQWAIDTESPVAINYPNCD